MVSKNDITGDKIQTKGVLSKEGEANWDTIFKKKKPLAEYELNKSTGEVQKVDVKKLIEAHNGH